MFSTRHLRPVDAPRLRAVPDSCEQRGGEVIEKLRDLSLRTRRTAQSELLADLAQHFAENPFQTLQGHEVAKYLIDRVEELS